MFRFVLRALPINRSTVIAACDRGGAWDICLWMLDEAREREEGTEREAEAEAAAGGTKANVFAYTAAISACGKAGLWEEAVGLLDVRERKRTGSFFCG